MFIAVGVCKHMTDTVRGEASGLRVQGLGGCRMSG